MPPAPSTQPLHPLGTALHGAAGTPSGHPSKQHFGTTEGAEKTVCPVLRHPPPLHPLGHGVPPARAGCSGTWGSTQCPQLHRAGARGGCFQHPGRLWGGCFQHPRGLWGWFGLGSAGFGPRRSISAAGWAEGKAKRCSRQSLDATRRSRMRPPSWLGLPQHRVSRRGSLGCRGFG